MWDNVLADHIKKLKPSELREMFKVLEAKDIIAFAAGVPSSDLFPVEDFSKAYADIFAKETEAKMGLQYAGSEGYLPLRQWLVEYMKTLGVEVDVSNILITSGSQQALDKFGKVFLSYGDTALVTWPTYLGAIQAFSSYNPIFEKLELEGENLADQYREKAKENNSKIKFAYLSTDFANPTGLTVSRKDRLALLDLAEELNIPILEDGAYQELRYEGEAVPPILALELEKKKDIEKTRTIYCGSFSKTMSPGLRLGWIVANKDVLSKLVILKQAADLHTSTLNQVALHKVVSNIFYDHMDKTRAFYDEKRKVMLAALEKHMPATVTWSKPEGGMFVWCKFPEDVDTAKLFEKAVSEHKVAFVPGAAFYPDRCHNNMCRLSFSSSTNEQIEEGIKRLGNLVKEAA